MSEFELHGSCDEAFAAVKDAFQTNFTEHDERRRSLRHRGWSHCGGPVGRLR